MSFLNPWAMIGLVAIALPILVHWMTKPRPVRVPLSTIRFVMQAVQQRRARHRLRDLLILLLRAAAVGLVAFAFMRPAGREQALVDPDALGDTVRIVILDQSQSMAAQANGIAAFERARPIAARYLDHRPGLRGNLILAGATAQAVFERPSANFAALREELSTAAAGAQQLNLQAALNRAGEMLGASSPSQRRELVVISDFQRGNWAGADFSTLPRDAAIQLESVAPAATPGNLAILRVSAQGRVEQGREVRVDVEVGNYSPAMREIEVELAIGRLSYRLKGMCGAGLTTVLSTPVVAAESGWQIGEARLLGVEDALGADNVRPVVLEVRATPTYVLVTREPANPGRSLSSHYLERALAPAMARPGQQAVRVVRVTPEDLNKDLAGGADLVVLDHPGKLPRDGINLLASLMRRGKAVLYVAADSHDATNLKLLAYAAGADLKMPVEFVPPGGQARRDLFLVSMKGSEAPFRVFGDGLPAAMGPIRFAGGLPSRKVEGGLADDVLATYSDQSACLVLTSCGAGSLAILNADLASSTLKSSPVFVVLLGELVSRMLSDRREDGALASGEPIAVYLPPDAGLAKGLSIVGPQEDAGALAEESNFVLWKRGPGLAAGTYQVQREGRVVFAAAAALPAVESDLRPIEETVLRERLAGGRAVHFRSAAGGGEEKKDDLWAWILVGCAICMMGEVAVVKGFRT